MKRRDLSRRFSVEKHIINQYKIFKINHLKIKNHEKVNCVNRISNRSFKSIIF